MKHLLWVIVFIAFVLPVKGQDYFDDDAGLWMGLKVNAGLAKKLALDVSTQARFGNNVSQIAKINTKLELTYKLNKNVRLTAGYLLGDRKAAEDYYYFRNRFFGGIILRKKIRQLTLSYRNLIQVQADQRKGLNNIYIPYDRNRIAISYNFSKRLELSLSQELNTDLSKREGFFYVSRTRSMADLTYNFSKSSGLSLYFLFQRKFGYKSQPERDFVSGVTFFVNL